MNSIPHTTTLRGAWTRFEACAGLVAVFIIACGPPMICGFALVVTLVEFAWQTAALTGTVFFITAPMAVWLIRMCSAALNEFRSPAGLQLVVPEDDDGFDPPRPYYVHVPFALFLTAQLPSFTRPFRVGLFLIWMGQFLAAALFAWNLTSGNFIQNAATVTLIFSFTLAYLFQFAANIFLVLAVAVLFGVPLYTVCVWRYRFLIDAAVIATPIVLRIVG